MTTGNAIVGVGEGVVTSVKTFARPHGVYVLRCVRCQHEVDGPNHQCDRCGGLLDAHYMRALEHGRGDVPTDPIERYQAVLPVVELESCRLSLPRTPLVDLGRIEGRRVLAKVEGGLPTGSTKDRLIAIALPFMLERGLHRFAFSSTGNTAAAYAHGLHLYPELEARIYLAPGVDRSTIEPLPPNLSVLVVNGDYAAASARVRADAERSGFLPEGGFFNVGRREGAKLAYLEAFSQMAERQVSIGAIVQAVASGLGIYAAARAIDDMRQAGRPVGVPRLCCAQQASCAPMVAAYHAESQGRRERPTVRDPSGITPALLLGDPFTSYDYVATAVRQSGGGFFAVDDSDVKEVLRRNADQHIPLGSSAAVALAAVPQIVKSMSPATDDAVLVMLTGGPNR